MTEIVREGGILLHPTSLPGNLWAGTMGEAARRFVDFLHDAGLGLWQVLPLGPTGDDGSPYQCLSAFAGNPLLLDFQELIDEGWLPEDAGLWGGGGHRADFDGLRTHQGYWMPQAWRRFDQGATPAQRGDFEAFCDAEAHWLDDYALFAALLDAHQGQAWWDWPEALAQRDAAALAEARQTHAEAIQTVRFGQHMFFKQWAALKTYANERGVRIVGDIPIFVALNSVEVWAQRELFLLDERGRPTFVAGVPPDYFSEDGQLWGNPLYDWDRLKADGYKWWMARFEAVLRTTDLVRVDHFRGFDAYWAVPAGDTNARGGSWVPGPGADFFTALREHFGEIPIIAEDLGDLTESVHELRDAFDLPGMKILHFAFGGEHDNAYLPHNFTTARCVVYPGTHDNNTTVGWLRGAGQAERDHLIQVLGSPDALREAHWAVIRLAWSSVAQWAIVAMQDLFGLDAEHRMNVPGVAKGNWGWRLKGGDDEAFPPAIAARLRRMSALFNRLPKEEDPAQDSTS